MDDAYLKKSTRYTGSSSMDELPGRWLRSTGSGQWWLLIDAVQPGLILCKNEVQLRGNLLGVYFKRLPGPLEGYDHAWQNQRSGAWDYAYSERSAALRWADSECPTRITIHTRHVIQKK